MWCIFPNIMKRHIIENHKNEQGCRKTNAELASQCAWITEYVNGMALVTQILFKIYHHISSIIIHLSSISFISRDHWNFVTITDEQSTVSANTMAYGSCSLFPNYTISLLSIMQGPVSI